MGPGAQTAATGRLELCQAHRDPCRRPAFWRSSASLADARRHRDSVAADQGFHRYRREVTKLGVAEARHERVQIRRSEEHTSELQSHLNLVCRLLLEKKNKTLTITQP